MAVKPWHRIFVAQGSTFDRCRWNLRCVSSGLAPIRKAEAKAKRTDKHILGKLVPRVPCDGSHYRNA